MSWPFGDLAPFSYDLIMADPPWSFKNWSKKGEHKNASAKYDCMDMDAIKALPVQQLAAPDSLLWLWATNPMLDQAIDVLKGWGFTFVTAGTWVKLSKTGSKLAFGTGYALRSANEPFLIGRMGSPRLSRSVRSALMAPVREHSRKPDLAFSEAERLIAPQAGIHAPRLLELFSRQSRKGWDAWGNEIQKFNLNNEEAAPTLQCTQSPIRGMSQDETRT